MSVTAGATESMYQEIILDHYRNPHHKGLRDPYDVEVHHVNPTCGDEVTLRVHLTQDGAGSVVGDVSYDALGCSISQAAASVLTELVVGRPLADTHAVYEAYLAMLQSKGADPGDESVLGDGVAFAGVSRYAARVKCALLPWAAYRDALLRADHTSTTEGRS